MRYMKITERYFSKQKWADVLFVLWAGGAALLSYSLVYALRKPFTAATFDGLDFFGIDYKTATSIIQIAGYFLSKLIGIKVISELKPQNRLKLIVASAAVAELSLVLFGSLPRPFNVFALFFNGLSLGYMWGGYLQLSGRPACHRFIGQHHGGQHCGQFGRGQVVGAVCDGHVAHQRLLDACLYRRVCFPIAVVVGMADDKDAAAFGRGQGSADGTGNHGWTYQDQGFSQLYAVAGIALYCQSFCHCVAGH